MKVINISYPFQKELTASKVVLALGFFDGVHIGHQKLIKEARTIADEKDLPLMVLTFDRHPKEVYAGVKDFEYLNSPQEKAYEMSKIGVDYLAIIKFTPEFSHLAPQAFVDEIIMGLKADTVVAGFDYSYGPKDVANMTNLPTFAKGRFEIKVVPKQIFAGEKIGSTEIRQAIKSGNLTLATELLGHPYLTSGQVVHGYRNGHKLGFPTANLQLDWRKVLPKIGVYATMTRVGDSWYQSMTSVGYNVMFNNERNIYIESNLFDFDQDIYGEQITIAWYKYLRDEQKFADLAGLTEQLRQDQQDSEDYFSSLVE
ncbi:riboflavin biosynthesis protein [Lactobacillus nasalidis]|uniref:Riboflavin biosynthesis protein n=1 Tax=Lactobacillus nasalidis TaxID=2797258 RepID=A0ABQ3W2Z4_9LACO|nr:riboflavin biosynthesis protein RibF [Lactobacillus nasalidis]GHV97453.1 riboflavin biosynthesis protein [Lactobacillus nasalidis]GHV99170.1 riboflavin biosynthesis protein [Lactobacillus nasalidis]GHW00723.1 riboflavin biosynthesis protein [Lactobacillus nasalidis]